MGNKSEKAKKVNPLPVASNPRAKTSNAQVVEVRQNSQGVMFKFDRDLNASPGGFSSGVSEEEVKLSRKNSHFDTNVKLLGNQVGEDIGKKTLVLDLDETLVHSVFGKEENPLCTFSLLFNKEYYLVSTHKRPHLEEFLEQVSKLYEIVFYTSSVEGYANNVIDYIDTEKKASGRLFRDS